VSRGPAARRPKEVFTGPRLAVRVNGGLRARSALALALLSLFLGAALAAGLAAGIGFGIESLVHSVGADF